MSEDKKKRGFSVYWIYALAGVAFIAIQLFYGAESRITIERKQTLFELVDSSGVEKITIINDQRANFKLNGRGIELVKTFKKGEYPKIWKQLKKEKTLEKQKKAEIVLENIGDLGNFENSLEKERGFECARDTETDYFGTILAYILPFGIIFLIWFFVMRRMTGGGGSGGGGGQIFNIGKSRAKLFDEKTEVKTTFKDVAGLEGAKEEIQEIVEFLKTPEKYTILGGKIPKGALLVGPPGTGKTLLAKAVAGEAKVPFFSLSGSDFVEMFVGVGASRVRDLFKQAKDKAPSIIFIDEIDAVGRARGKNNMSGGNDERENTLNQLLTEMDGFGTHTQLLKSSSVYKEIALSQVGNGGDINEK